MINTLTEHETRLKVLADDKHTHRTSKHDDTVSVNTLIEHETRLKVLVDDKHTHKTSKHDDTVSVNVNENNVVVLLIIMLIIHQPIMSIMLCNRDQPQNNVIGINLRTM